MRGIGRRSVLGALGALAMTPVTGFGEGASQRKAFFAGTGLPIGLQVYTLGDEAGKDIDATFAAVAGMGYREIELPGLLGHEPTALAAAAKRADLQISSIHLPVMPMGGPAGLSLASDPASLADALGALGAQWAVAPILLLPADFRPQAGESIADSISRSVAAAGEDIWKKTAALLNEKAHVLKPLGIKVGYHNHNLEFAPIGTTNGWDILWQETQADLVHFEVDIGWVATAGHDPVDFLRGTQGRVKLMHVKDVAADNPSGFGITMSPAEVGSGKLDWARILPEAWRSGVRHFFVEQEPPFRIERMEAARLSHAYLAALQTDPWD